MTNPGARNVLSRASAALLTGVPSGFCAAACCARVLPLSDDGRAALALASVAPLAVALVCAGALGRSALGICLSLASAAALCAVVAFCTAR